MNSPGVLRFRRAELSLRAAVVGVGFVGRAHVEALRRQGIPVQGILGSSLSRTKETCRALSLPRAYGSLEELLSDSSIDVVHLCTPNHLHFPHAQAALRAGKHVMCEKPLAMNAAETATLVQEVQKCGRVGGVTYNQRYYPLCQEAHALVRSGAIGEPRLVHGTFLQDWLLYSSDWNWRLEADQGGEMRAVSDIGTHWLDLITWITGRNVVEVCADLATVLPVRQRPLGRVETFQKTQSGAFEDVKMTTDDYASVLLHFQGGMRGVMTVSQVSAGRKNRLWFEIDGSEGSLAWNAEEPNILWMGKRNEPNRILIKNPALMSPETRSFAAYPGGHAEGYPDTFMQLFKDFYSYTALGNLQAERTFPTFETGHTEVALCDVIAASARERRWVAFP